MEALFNRKKLITNNVNIISESFYSDDKIFVIGKDPIERLKDFIYSPMTGLSDEEIEMYNVSSWFNNFNYGK